MLNDTLANALSKILNNEKIGKPTTLVRPVSHTLKKVFTLMQDNQYIGEFEEHEDGRGGSLQIHLLGRINKCGAIKPRYPIKRTDFEKFEKRYLPAKDFGIIIVSTTKGMMTHIEAKKQNLGGVLIAYCY